jgi:hypothetical protein
MRFLYILTIPAVVLVFTVVFTGSASAQGDWVMEWYAFDFVPDTGTHGEGIAEDWLLTIYGKPEAEFSTLGIPDPDDKVTYKGKEMGWFVGNLGATNDDRNLSNGIYGGEFGDMSNYVFYGIILVRSPNQQDTVMHVAQDDQLKVWNNGELIATDTSWTGGAETTRPHEITLEKGLNVMLFKVSEQGGGDYLNVRFDAEDLEITGDIPGNNPELSVSPESNAVSTWGGIKNSQ